MEKLQPQQYYPTCQFQQTLQYLMGMLKISSSKTSDKLRNHLLMELQSAKAQVAFEMGYDENTVYTAMALNFLRKSRGFKNAGELIGSLMDNEERPDTKSLIMTQGLEECASLEENEQQLHQEEGITSLSNYKRPSENHNEELLKETLSLHFKTLCKVCFEKDVTYLALPCGDVSVCEKCIAKQKWCPICYNEVDEFLRIYF